MRRAARVGAVVAALCGAVLLLLGALWAGGNTDAGHSFIAGLTARLTEGRVRLAGLGGSFPLRPTLRGLELRDTEGVWLTAEDVVVEWSPLALLAGRIDVVTASVAHVRVERAPLADKPAGTTSLPHVDVHRFAVARLDLGAALAGAPATLSLRGQVEIHSLEAAEARLEARRTDGEGEYALTLHADRQRLDGSLSVREPAHGPLENVLSVPGLGALTVTAALHGPRTAARIDISVRAGELTASAHGTVDVVRRTADLAYALAAPAVAPRADLGWDAAELAGTWSGTFAAPVAQGHLTLSGLRLPGATRVADVHALLAARAGRIDVQANLVGLEVPGPDPRLFARDPLTLDAAIDLGAPTRPVEFKAVHRLFTCYARFATAAGAGAPASLQLNLPDIAPLAALLGEDVQGEATLRARLTRSPGWHADLDGGLSLKGGAAPWVPLLGPRMTLKLGVAWSDDAVEVDGLRLAGGVVSVAASGTAKRPTPRRGPAAPRAAPPGFLKDIEARWQLEVADLAPVSNMLAGPLKASGRIAGAPGALTVDAEAVSRLSVLGTTAAPVQATAHIHGLPGAPSGTLRVRGKLEDAPLEIAAALEPGERGELRLLLSRAQWKTAHLEGEVSAEPAGGARRGQIRFAVGQLGDFAAMAGTSLTGRLDGNLTLAPGTGYGGVHLLLDGKQVGVGQLSGNVQLEAGGTGQVFDVHLAAQLPDQHGQVASLKAGAVLDPERRELRIEHGDLGYHATQFKLLAPMRILYDRGLAVGETRIGGLGAVLSLQGRISPSLDLQGSLQHGGAGLVNLFFPQLLAAGNVDARARLGGTLANPTGTVSVDATDLRLADESAVDLPPMTVRASAQLDGNLAAMRATLDAGSGSKLAASGDLPLAASGRLAMKVTGALDAATVNPLLEARGLHAGGLVAVDATITGTPAAPQVGGSVTLNRGSLRDYGRGVNLSAIEAKLTGNQAGELVVERFKATAISGGIGLSGSIGVLQPGMPVDLHLTAQNARPVASAILTADMDADLRIRGRLRERIDVAGTVQVKRATIGIPNSLPPEVAVLDVQRRGSAAAAAGDKQLIVGVEVLLQAPQQILVQGRGLDAELGGEMRLAGTTDALTASGGFDLQRGSFSLAGTRLNFTQGRVGFDGAGLRKKIDPTLDFTAQTQLADSTAILRITGFADAPRFEFSSTPPLPQDEIMARLLFGENAAQLSALQVAQIGAALATLSGVGGVAGPLVKLQKTLGLDRLTVGSNNTTNAAGTESSGAAIAAGRYISKRVYVEGKQTTSGTSQVQVDVDLTKHLKLQTRLGNGTATTQGTTPENDPGSSIGLSYQFEY